MIARLTRPYISIPQSNIISDAISYIRIHNCSRTETHMRTWFRGQKYDNDYHYFEMRLMSRENIIRKFDVQKNEYVFLSVR